MGYLLPSRHRPVTSTLFVVVFCAALKMVPAAYASKFYVDNSVPSSGNGTSWASAWKGFGQIRWSIIRAGDTIYISGGASRKTYKETLIIGAGGSQAGLITVTKGADAGHNGTVIINGQNRRPAGVIVSGRNYVVVKNLSIRNHTRAGIDVEAVTAGVIIENNNIYSGDPGPSNARGIDARNNTGAKPLIVRGNRFRTPRNTTAQTDGIWSSGNDGVIFENNHIVISNNNTNGHSDGIQSHMDFSITIRRNWIEQANTAATDNHGLWLSNTQSGGIIKVYNNVVLTPNLTMDSAVAHRAEAGWTGRGTVRLWNNTIYGGLRCIFLDKSPRAEVKNNILWPSPRGYAVFMLRGDVPARNIVNNLIWDPNAFVAYVSDSTVDWSEWRSLGYDAGGLNANPRFVDVSRRNYRLRSASPAIDKARALPEINVDQAGTVRPQGAAPDIGAFERR
jgi:hypothetical protein